LVDFTDQRLCRVIAFDNESDVLPERESAVRKNKGILTILTPFFRARQFDSEKAVTCGKTRHQIKLSLHRNYPSEAVRVHPNRLALHGRVHGEIGFPNPPLLPLPPPQMPRPIFALVMLPPYYLCVSNPNIVLNFHFSKLFSKTTYSNTKIHQTLAHTRKSCPNVAHFCLF